MTRLSSALSRLTLLVCGATAALVVLSPSSTQTAVANGDTRTINLVHAHTHERISATFRVNGRYDPATLKRLNWFLRDWRNDDVTNMDPRLFDVIWEAQRGAGSTEPIQVNSAYRSPETNAMLRRRSRGVAKQSQHIRGKAMDIHVSDVPIKRLRETAMRMQRGGVGYYPSSGFVHLDVGSVRAWPRMSYDQLVRLFPDGKTVHLPSNGQPLARYEEARAELEARGGLGSPTLAQVRSKGFFATLFGLDGDSEDDAPRAVAQRRAPAVRTAALAPRAAGDNATAAAFFRADEALRSQASAPAPAGRVRAPSVATVESPPASAPTNLPLPPRRPGLVQVAEATPAPAAPLPPQRPPALLAFATAEPPMPARRPGVDQIAGLIGAVGSVAATPGLPSVITEGVAPGMLAYAPAAPPARPEMRARQMRSAPIAARAFGIRAARHITPSTLTAARLDRSNFAALTTPVSLFQASPSSDLGSMLGPLRSSARRDAAYLMFAPPTERVALALRDKFAE